MKYKGEKKMRKSDQASNIYHPENKISMGVGRWVGERKQWERNNQEINQENFPEMKDMDLYFERAL